MGLRGASRRLWNRLSPGGLIVLYHRVAELAADPFSLAISPANFEQHLGALLERGKPMPLDQMNERLQHGALESRSFAVSFDDGYLDNLEQAAPILARLGVPATFFVASGYLGGDREFWWDALERAVLEPPALPEALELSVGGTTRAFALGTAAKEPVSGRPVGFQDQRESPVHPRLELFRDLWWQLRAVEDAERRRTIDRLFAWSGADPRARASHRAMSAEELRTLDRTPGMTIGAHTVSHPVLSTLSPGEQRSEMAEGRAALEAVLGHPVTSFAYPFGRRADYDRTSVEIAEQLGFRLACTTHAAVLRRGARPLELPRASPRNFERAHFQRWLDRYLPA
jgi:peptidoglycan/xylan/chitin deacetylase (PgdA/CDA1 family)